MSRLLLLLLFLVGCSPKSKWIQRENISDYPQFSSCQWIAFPENAFNGIEVEILRGQFGTRIYLNVHCGVLASAKALIRTESEQWVCEGILMKGSQKLLLPEPAASMLLEAIAQKRNISISIDHHFTTLEPLTIKSLSEKQD